MSVTSYLLFQQLLLARLVYTQIAPGDEAQLCEELRADHVIQIPTYPDHIKVLMDSWNYRNLLPPRAGAVWDQVDDDMNNPVETTTNVGPTIDNIDYIVYNIYGPTPHTRLLYICLLYTSPSPRDATLSRMPSSA